MKFSFLVVVSGLIIFLMFYLQSCDQPQPEHSEQDEVEEPEYEFRFDQIGYYKKNKVRIFTFGIQTTKQFTRDSIPEELWSAIEVHGSKQMNTKGRSTRCFYFMYPNVPDISNATSTGSALDMAYAGQPLADYHMLNGSEGMDRHPR